MLDMKPGDLVMLGVTVLRSQRAFLVLQVKDITAIVYDIENNRCFESYITGFVSLDVKAILKERLQF